LSKRPLGKYWMKHPIKKCHLDVEILLSTGSASLRHLSETVSTRSCLDEAANVNSICLLNGQTVLIRVFGFPTPDLRDWCCRCMSARFSLKIAARGPVNVNLSQTTRPIPFHSFQSHTLCPEYVAHCRLILSTRIQVHGSI
jgi:hypothetical protein